MDTEMLGSDAEDFEEYQDETKHLGDRIEKELKESYRRCKDISERL